MTLAVRNIADTNCELIGVLLPLEYHTIGKGSQPIRTKDQKECLCVSIQCGQNYYFHQLKMVLSEIYLSFAVVSVGNIRNVHFQTFILPLIVIIEWGFCLTTASAPQRSDLIIIIIIQSVWNDIRNWTNWDRLNTKELWQRLFKRSTCKATRKTMCTYRAKAALNTKDGHTKCWFNLVNSS